MSLSLLMLDLDHKVYRASKFETRLQICLYLLYLMISLAFTVASSYFLRYSMTCPLHQTTLILLAVYHGIDSLRCLLALFYILGITRSTRLYSVFGVNSCLGFVTFAFLHRCYMQFDDPIAKACSNETQQVLNIFIVIYWCILSV